MSFRRSSNHPDIPTPTHDTRTIVNSTYQPSTRRPLSALNFVENHPTRRRGNIQKTYAYKRDYSNDRENRANCRKKPEQEKRLMPIKIYDIRNYSDKDRKNKLNELLGPYVPMDTYNEIMKIYDTEIEEKKEITELLQKEKLKKEEYQKLYNKTSQDNVPKEMFEEKEQSICKLRYRIAILERQLNDKAEISYRNCTERLIKCAAGFIATAKRITCEEVLENKLIEEETFHDMVKCGERTFDLGRDRRALVEDLTGYAKGDPKCSFRLWNGNCDRVLVADADRHGNEFRVEGKRVFKETRI